MRCPWCSYENPIGAQFCGECGARLERLCPNCGTVNPVTHNFCFENLHWIDSETQALLDSLVESLAAARLMLLVSYRPEYQHGWGSHGAYTQLRLAPLSPASVEELLQAVLGGNASLQPLK